MTVADDINVMTAAELRHWRSHWLITQPQLARSLGCTVETVSRWERGAVPVPTWLPLALETLARRRAADLAARSRTAPTAASYLQRNEPQP